MRLGVTQGDAGGVGPEIVVRALAEDMSPDHEILVYGDLEVLSRAAQAFEVKRPMQAYQGRFRPGVINVVDHGCLSGSDVRPGEVSGRAGAAALRYFDSAINDAQKGDIDAIVTLPICKEACQINAPGFQGHTDYLAQKCGVSNYTLMLASPTMIATHVSVHVSLQEAIRRVTRQRILDLVRLTAPVVERLRGRARLAVAGLNPHAGENGLFGDEEQTRIIPAVEAAREEGFDVSGPFPPDTVFMLARRGDYDAVICMYHDQGHIPMKLMAFEAGVNVTLGLPLVRTSVDHGTAFDIAWKGVASLENFHSACDLALTLSSPGMPE